MYKKIHARDGVTKNEKPTTQIGKGEIGREA
jgi:hypothetical protein